MNRMKTILLVMLIMSLLGLALCAAFAEHWKEAALGGLFGICNILIFLVK